jgi:hypothetical protein
VPGNGVKKHLFFVDIDHLAHIHLSAVVVNNTICRSCRFFFNLANSASAASLNSRIARLSVGKQRPGSRDSCACRRARIGRDRGENGARINGRRVDTVGREGRQRLGGGLGTAWPASVWLFVFHVSSFFSRVSERTQINFAEMYPEDHNTAPGAGFRAVPLCTVCVATERDRAPQCHD